MDVSVSYHPTPEHWLPLVEQDRPLRTSSVYEQHFAAWYMLAQTRARQVAEQEFCGGHDAAHFIVERRQELEAERGRQDEWLRQRTREITGEVVAAMPQACPEASLRWLVLGRAGGLRWRSPAH